MDNEPKTKLYACANCHLVSELNEVASEDKWGVDGTRDKTGLSRALKTHYHHRCPDCGDLTHIRSVLHRHLNPNGVLTMGSEIPIGWEGSS